MGCDARLEGQHCMTYKPIKLGQIDLVCDQSLFIYL